VIIYHVKAGEVLCTLSCLEWLGGLVCLGCESNRAETHLYAAMSRVEETSQSSEVKHQLVGDNLDGVHPSYERSLYIVKRHAEHLHCTLRWRFA
jgi:hypothetical protein